MEIVKKSLQYIGGMLLIAVGINLSKLTKLGISPVSSIPRAVEQIWGVTLGTATIIIQLICILLQFVLLRKKFRPVNVLGVLVGVAFGWLIDLTGTDPKAFGHLMYGFPVPASYWMRLLYMLISVVLIGAGVYLYLKPRWVPMATDGLSQAVAEVSGKPFGDCKTAVDTGMILIAAILQVIFLGGLSSFVSPSVVVREGTVVAAVFVGQVVKLITGLVEKGSRRRGSE